jgi:hypothetical protein
VNIAWIVPTLILGGVIGAAIDYSDRPSVTPPAPPPFCIDDAQKVVAALRPLVPEPYDTYVYLFGDGDIHVVVDTKVSKLVGKGTTLKAAVAQLSQAGDATKAALVGVLP